MTADEGEAVDERAEDQKQPPYIHDQRWSICTAWENPWPWIASNHSGLVRSQRDTIASSVEDASQRSPWADFKFDQLVDGQFFPKGTNSKIARAIPLNRVVIMTDSGFGKSVATEVLEYQIGAHSPQKLAVRMELKELANITGELESIVAVIAKQVRQRIGSDRCSSDEVVELVNRKRRSGNLVLIFDNLEAAGNTDFLKAICGKTASSDWRNVRVIITGRPCTIRNYHHDMLAHGSWRFVRLEACNLKQIKRYLARVIKDKNDGVEEFCLEELVYKLAAHGLTTPRHLRQLHDEPSLLSGPGGLVEALLRRQVKEDIFEFLILLSGMTEKILAEKNVGSPRRPTAHWINLEELQEAEVFRLSHLKMKPAQCFEFLGQVGGSVLEFDLHSQTKFRWSNAANFDFFQGKHHRRLLSESGELKPRTEYLEILQMNLLERSKGLMHNLLHLELGVKTISNMVLVYKCPFGEQTSTRSLEQAFEDANGQLLVMGGPGSGKTTSLVDLALQLTDAAIDSTFRPIPVLFNLSKLVDIEGGATSLGGFQISQPALQMLLVECLEHDLRRTYKVQKSMTRQWIANGSLAFLMDGLDEVAEDKRESVVELINSTVLAKFPNAIVVIASRKHECLELRKTMGQAFPLNEAVELEPLSHSQVVSYMNEASTHALLQVIERDAGLSELSKNPLNLGMMVLAYRNRDDIPIGNSVYVAKQKLLEDYTERALQRVERRRRGDVTDNHPSLDVSIDEYEYSPQKSHRYLIWVASHLGYLDQSVFSKSNLYSFLNAYGRGRIDTDPRDYILKNLAQSPILFCALFLVSLPISTGILQSLAIAAVLSILAKLTNIIGWSVFKTQTVGLVLAPVSASLLLGAMIKFAHFGLLGTFTTTALAVCFACSSSVALLSHVQNPNNWRLQRVLRLVFLQALIAFALLGTSFGIATLFGIEASGVATCIFIAVWLVYVVKVFPVEQVFYCFATSVFLFLLTTAGAATVSVAPLIALFPIAQAFFLFRRRFDIWATITASCTTGAVLGGEIGACVGFAIWIAAYMACHELLKEASRKQRRSTFAIWLTSVFDMLGECTERFILSPIVALVLATLGHLPFRKTPFFAYCAEAVILEKASYSSGSGPKEYQFIHREVRDFFAVRNVIDQMHGTVKANVMRKLVHLGEAGANALGEFLDDEAAETRRNAVSCLGEIGSYAIIPHLKNAMSSGDVDLRVRAVLATEKLESEQQREVLECVTHEQECRVKLASMAVDAKREQSVAGSFSEFPDWSVPELIEILNDNAEFLPIRSAAARCLGRIGDKSAVLDLIYISKYPYDAKSFMEGIEKRKSINNLEQDAICALGEIGDARAYEILERKLQFGSWSYAAVIAIGKIGDPRGRKLLEGMLAKATSDQREVIQHSLQLISLQNVFSSTDQ